MAGGQERGWAGSGLTRSVRGDDSLGRDAHATVINRQLLAGQTLGPRVTVLDKDRLAALPGPLAHGLAGLDGLVLEVNGADGRVHGTEEEEQIGTAVGAQQTFELLDGQNGVGLGAVVQVVGHLGHVPGQGLAQGDADGLTGCSPSSGHPEQAKRRQGEQLGPQQQHPSRTATDHDPGRTGQGGAVPSTPRGPLRRPLLPPASGHNDLGASPPPTISVSLDQIPPMGSHELRRPPAAAAPAALAVLSRRLSLLGQQHLFIPCSLWQKRQTSQMNPIRGKQEEAREK